MMTVFEPRRPGTVVTNETRGEAYEYALANQRKRYREILECFDEAPQMTAREVAERMCGKGYIPTAERNFTAPRLHELEALGIVRVIGKTKCATTGVKVAVYERVKEDE